MKNGIFRNLPVQIVQKKKEKEKRNASFISFIIIPFFFQSLFEK